MRPPTNDLKKGLNLLLNGTVCLTNEFIFNGLMSILMGLLGLQVGLPRVILGPCSG